MSDWKSITFFGEEEFPLQMEGLQPWLQNKVQQGDFHTTDGMRLHYYYGVPEHAYGTVVLVHGFCEFFGKYHEMAHYLYEAGYAFFFLEQRGHGFSDRQVENLSKVLVYDYDDYVQDLREFVKFVVEPKKPKGRMALLAHSMGGMVATLFAERYPGVFSGVILSSPMLAVNTGRLPKWLVPVVKTVAILLGWMERYCPGQQDFDGVEKPESSSAKSKARYHYQFQLRKTHREYQTSGATYGWIIAGLRASKRVMQEAMKIQDPVLMLCAGRDTVVDTSGQLHFQKLRPDIQVVTFDESKHEIYNASQEERKEYYKQIFTFLDITL